ncbi:hypothetical protein ALO52_200157 [Pseudomonas syringae pv. primulae]|uniref:Uncharacterized protein n=1 Tax=Pseudomonas syringae pv. primulae TaxID=251707 RepID=A0A0P9XAT5_9PSED|nr:MULTISPECIES: hypothetical protein [Pseudomonas syringae group]KPY31466.1 hypothetical protein ALO52_200157 [Pseudomonas syringae pv. primulae]MBD8185602.1 hypothetical protein [Pseudomonas viridiflava]
MKDTDQNLSAATAQTDIRTMLLELLKSDDHVRQAIQQIAVTSPAPRSAVPQSQPNAPYAERELLSWINADAELKDAWLSVEEPAERQLVRLIATAAQWDRLLLLWDRFADRCKNEKRKASPTELNILGRSLDIHNLIWQERQANLQTARTGTAFDPLLHERGQLKGDTVSAQWLPGLRNAAGQLQRKPVVCT